MLGEKREYWRHLCEQIAEEQNPDRFSELVQELLAELEAKEKRLKRVSTPTQPSESE